MASGSSNEEMLTDDLKQTKELVVSLLKDKRALLISLRNERRAGRKRDEECKALHRQVEEFGQSIACRSHSVSSTLERFNVSPNDSLKARLDCEAENATLLQKINASEQDIRKAQRDIKELKNQKFVLEAEVVRLAESLNKTTVSNLGGLLKEQLHVYEEDFKKEKGEKQTAECRVVTLEHTVKDCEDLISTLTHEVDMYKSAYEREKREKEFVLFHLAGSGDMNGNLSHSQPERVRAGMSASVTPSHHFELVFPIVDATAKEQNQRRKKELKRVGVFARNSNATDGLFYDGNFEVDYSKLS